MFNSTGKRKCEVGEYASICEALGVNVDRFIKKKPRIPEKTKEVPDALLSDT